MNADAESGEVAPHGGRNDLLRLARLRTPSPSDPSKPMSQRELAEAATTYVQRTTGRDVALDRHDVSRWERGKRRLPTAEYRDALKAVLGAGTDADLGFCVEPRSSVRHQRADGPTTVKVNQRSAEPAGVDAATVQLVVSPGMAIVLVPVNQVTLSAMVPALANT